MEKEGARQILDEIGADPRIEAALSTPREGHADPETRALARRMRPTDTVHGMLRAINGDLDAIVGRFALVLAHLEEGDPTDEEATTALQLYAALADRLGMAKLRARLEDAAFRVLDPAAYEELAAAVGPVQLSDQQALGLLVEFLQRLLERNGIRGSISFRTKSLYGIHRKMQKSGLPLGELHDRLGVRLIVPTVPECYLTLGLVHTHLRPVPGLFRDYIGVPKANGYQSLHTTVFPVPEVCEQRVEIQIRTPMMHDESELGVAAHWRYRLSEQAALQRRHTSGWLKRLSPLAEASPRFLETLQERAYQATVVVFVNGGRVVRVSAGTTVAELLTELDMSTDEIRVDEQPVDGSLVLEDGMSVRSAPSRSPLQVDTDLST